MLEEMLERFHVAHGGYESDSEEEEEDPDSGWDVYTRDDRRIEVIYTDEEEETTVPKSNTKEPSEAHLREHPDVDLD